MTHQQAILAAMISARERRGLTQSDIADRMGVGQSFVSKIECGYQQRLSLQLVSGYLKASGCSATLMIDGGVLDLPEYVCIRPDCCKRNPRSHADA